MQTLSLKEEQQQIYTVSRLNSSVRFLLEGHFPFVWVEGEISNFAAPNSGHWYFSLKDAAAQVRCAMFKGHQRHLGFVPKDGMHVLIKARVSLYENRGEFQLIAEVMEERGEGKLRRALEALKKKLEAEGLFAPAHKKTLPLFPKQIGVITSATGAAIRDILHVLKRRYSCVPVIIYPTLVQGNQAAPHIVNAIALANQRKECDVLILARGGGSLEDLWPFNEEKVARAIYASDLPIISGVGHEVDFTIADFVADKRAPTPSAAAEIATPDKAELLVALARNHQQILRQMQVKLTQAKQQLTWMQTHLQQQHPKRQLTEKIQRLDFLSAALVQVQTRLLNQYQSKIKDLNLRLHKQAPHLRIKAMQHQLHLNQQQLNHHIVKLLNRQQAHLANLAIQLDTLSPLATLKRGYAIAMTSNNQITRDINTIQIGQDIQVRLMQGTIDCVVKNVRIKK